MNWYRELPLRIQLLLLAILLTLPSLGIIIFSGLKARSDALKTAAIETQKLTDNIVADQEHLTHEALQLGKLIAQLPDVQRHNAPKVDSILATTLKDNPQYLGLLICDRTGDVWASAVPLNHHISLADRMYFKKALASHGFSSGEYVLTKDSNRPTLAMGYPIINEQGEFEGVVALGFNLDQLRKYLERSQLPEDTNYVLTDLNGIIISRGYDNDRRIGTPIPPDVLKDMEGGPDKYTHDFTRYDGLKRITTYRKLWLSGEDKPYMYIRTGISVSTAVAGSNREMVHNIALLIPFVLIAFALAVYIGKRSITDKITVLESAAQLLAKGQYPGKISDLAHGGELGRLGQSFDDMAQQLMTRERALQESERKYRILFEDAGDYILVLAPAASSRESFLIIDANHAACSYHGYRREELLGNPVTMLEDPSCREKTRSTLKLEKPGDFFLLETMHVRKDGSTFPIEASLRMLQIGDEPPVILAIERDISMRRQAEEAIREANRFSEQIIRSAQDGVIVYDLDLRYRVWNPFMERLSGMTADEVLGRHPLELFPFLRGSHLIERLEKALSGETPDSIDIPYSFPEIGTSGWCSNQSAPIRNTKGEIIGVIATIREITWRMRLHDELQQALESVKRSNGTMSRLLHTIAHEFRTPLGLLTGSTDILDRYWDRLTPEKRFEQNEHIRSAARQMSKLIDSVTSFNQWGTDRTVNPLVALDIAGICRAVAEEVATVWGTGRECNITMAADCGTALLNEILIRRILENLLTNAFRYTPQEGVVSLHARREEGRLLLEIIDTGIGIPEGDQAMIFDAFYRSRNVEGAPGLGVGLSIVREALSQMDGIITVTSRTGEGTTMRVEIPVNDSE